MEPTKTLFGLKRAKEQNKYITGEEQMSNVVLPTAGGYPFDIHAGPSATFW
jgi:hypothetical protein